MRRLAIILLAISAIAQTPSPGQPLTPPQSRSKAPEFALTAVNGEKISISALHGRVILLDFWATTCGGCKIELPWYVEFDTRYRARGLAVVGLDMYGETPQIIRPFMTKWNMHYPVAVGTDAIGEKFNLAEMPLTILIDRQGRIALSHAGIVDKNAFEQSLRTLLEE